MDMNGVNDLCQNIGETIKTVPEFYRDGLQPVVQETGKLIALPIKAINAALSGVYKWIAQQEYNVEETKKLLALKLEKVSVDKIVSPEPYIAVPAIQAISYSMNSDELRDLYANLLATSMISDKKWNVHPSFVEIIKQLSPDEAKLLKLLNSLNTDSFPIIDLNLVYPEGNYTVILKNFTDIADETCEHPDKIVAYLDNLERLKIIEIPFGVHLADDKMYKHLEEHPYIKEVKESIHNPFNKKYKLEYKRKEFQLTRYGKNFIDICVNNP